MKRVRLLAAVGAALLAGPVARADGTADLEGLLNESVVTTASKIAETESNAPATSTTITAEELRKYGIHSLGEAINYLSLGMVAQDALHRFEVGSRGVLLNSDFGDHVLLLVNGHVLNEPGAGAAYFDQGVGVPFELIDHIEVILGPGSVLYGSEAMLGVINIITKRAKDYAGIHVIAEGELVPQADRQGTFVTPALKSSYLSDLGNTYRFSVGIGKEFRLLGKHGEITFQAEYYSQNGPALFFGPQFVGNDPVTGQPKRFSLQGPGNGLWTGKNGNAFSKRVPAAYLRAVLGNFEFNAFANSLAFPDPYLSQWISPAGAFDDPNYREVAYLAGTDLRYRAEVSSVAELRSRVYADYSGYAQYVDLPAPGDCLPGQDNGCTAYLPFAVYWAGLEEQLSLDWLRDASFVTLLGTDARVRDVSSKIDGVDAITHSNTVGSLNVFTEKAKSLALYGQQTARPFSWLSLNAGARYDGDERYGGKVSPRTAMNINPWRGGTIKGIYSEAFRAPTANEVYFANPLDQLPAQNLKPETVRSIEGSFEQRFGAQRILFGIFRTFWDDMIGRNTLSAAEVDAGKSRGALLPSSTVVFQYQNIASIDNYGFNMGYSGLALDRRLQYGFNITGAYARRTATGLPSLPVTVAPQFFGNARVAYDLQNELPTLALAAHFIDSVPADRAVDGGFTPTPYAPANLTLRATVSGLFPGVKGLSYRLTTDYSFASFGPYVAGPYQSAPPGVAMPAELAPLVRFHTGIGLQYDFDP